VIALLLGLASAAETRSLSIEEALRIAQDASEAVEIAVASDEATVGDIWTARSAFLPSVTASANYTRTFESEMDKVFGSGDESDNPLSQENSWRVGVDAQQGIFGGGRAASAFKIAQASRAASRIGVETARASAGLDAAGAYYDAALADRLYEIAQSTLAQAETTYGHAKVGNEVGRTSEFELLRAQVEVENQRVNVIRMRRARDTAHLRLAQTLDLPEDTALELVSPLDDSAPVSEIAIQVVDVRAATGATERAAYAQVAETVRIAEGSVGVARAALFPQIGLQASYYKVNPSVNFMTGEDTGIRTNSSAAIGLQWALIGGGRAWGALDSARADLTAARAQLDQVRELVELDTRDASLGLESANAQWEATAGTVQVAERAYGIAEVRFQEGLSTQSELADARVLLQQALANRAQAARDVQVARIRVALLPSLPITMSGF
jgi:outer membrane protein TolC